MVYFNRPTVTRTYTEVLTDLDAKIDAATGLLSSDVTAYNNEGGTFPVRAIRWNASSNKFERRNSANNAWESLSSNHAFTAITASGNITSTSGNISGAGITASGQLQASRVNVTGTTAPANGFYLPATNEVRFTTNGTDRLTIESNGDVGIGTVNPAQALEVQGLVRIQNGTGNTELEIGEGGSGNRSAFISLTGDDTYTQYGCRLIRGNTGANTTTELHHRGTGDFVFEANEAADMIFKTTNLTRFVIDSGGNIGIGNNVSPTANLHIKRSDANGNFIRFENTEGSAYIRGDQDILYLDADATVIRNEAGTTDYLEADSSLFNIKTAAKVNGALEVTGTLTASITGTADVASKVAIADESTDTSCNVLFATQATGNLAVKSGTNLTFNSSGTGTLTTGTFSGALSGTASNATTFSNKTLSVSGNRFDVVPWVASDGVMEVGRYIDFHDTDGSTGDNAGRIYVDTISSVGVFLINKSWMPIGSCDLGGSSNRWQNLYINDLQLSNEGQTNDVDGTWGDYTIQEGENDLYLLNRRNGKTYKFDLTEVG